MRDVQSLLMAAFFLVFPKTLLNVQAFNEYSNTNLKDPIHHLLQSYLCRHQFHLEVEGRALK